MVQPQKLDLWFGASSTPWGLFWPLAEAQTGVIKASLGPRTARSSSPWPLCPSTPQQVGCDFYAVPSVSFRINPEGFLLAVQVRARPDWLLVCHEGWSSALGLRICQSLGHLR